MKTAEKPPVLNTKIELQLSQEVVEALRIMESFTKISQNSLVETAMRRFIAAHKDYFPDSK